MKRTDTLFKNLTWDDLQEWAGTKILNRGKSYVNNVSGLAGTADGEWVAWVSGTDDYATLVAIEEDGEIYWQCTCPYDWGPCKHAVAVILAGLERLKAGRELPLLDQESELSLTLLEDFGGSDALFDEGDFDDKGSTDKVEKSALEKLLGRKKKGELVDLLIDLAGRYPEVRRGIMEEEQLASGQIEKLVAALRGEIQGVTDEDALYDRWNNRGDLPDYCHIRQRLAALLDKGHADAVVELGDELWEGGNEQVAQSHDDGDVAEEIHYCMAIVFKAIRASSLTPSEQLLKMIDIFLTDEYSICDSLDASLQRKEYSKEHWREVAEQLEKRLLAMPLPKKDDYSQRYRRERLMGWLVNAYEKSGQDEKIVPMYEKEVKATQCYERLVRTLVRNGQLEKARSWCIKGFQETHENARGIARSLRNTLEEIAAGEKKFNLVASYRAEEFFDRPGISSYQELQKAAEKIGAWPEVRAAVLHFLETGERPGHTAGGSQNNKWPLPPPEVVAKPRRGGLYNHYPDLNHLIEIAILEKRFDDVVQFYQKQMKTLRWGTGMGRQVAEAVAETHPDVSLEIWKRIVVAKIKLVKPKEYESAGGYLRKMRKVYQENQRITEWKGLIADLRVEHKAKRRLMEVLDALENKKIIG